MGHSQAGKAATHQRIVEIAARRFREVGLNGIGVAEVMKEAGLTVGGFYKHFGSRDDLVSEAVAMAFTELDTWEREAEGLRQMIVECYLTESHRDAPGSGCGIAALAGEIRLSNDAARAVYTARVEHSLLWSAGLLAIADPAARRDRAILLLSACVGGISLARAVSDPGLSEELLASLARQLVALLPGPVPS